MGGRLVGRDTELERIAAAVVSARGGGTRCLLVTGEAGIGKSRLVAAAVSGLDDALVLTGHAVDMATGEIPFGVVADTLRDLVRVAGPDALQPGERDALASLLPGGTPGTQVDRVQLLSAFLDLLERLTADRLVVWVVEDLHWADSATRDLVSLAARTVRSSLLIVATVRTDDPERSAEADTALTTYVAGLARTPGCELFPVTRLSQDAVLQQLRDLLGSVPSAEVATRVERLSDGIPFVVEELVAAAGRPELSTVASVATGRLAGLGPEARRLVEAAAIGDGHLRISLLERVLDATPDELDVALAEVIHAGILTTDHTSDAVGFRHALLREATDRELGPGARRSWHRRWAEVLEESAGVLASDPAALAIAEHWHQARDVRRALAATVAAMPSAERVCLPGEEAVLWTRVMEAFGALDDAAEVAGMSVREAWGRGVLGVTFATRAQRAAFSAAVPVDRMTPTERAAVALLAEDDHAKGEANFLPEEAMVAADAAFADEPPDLMSVVVWAAVGSRSTDVAHGSELEAKALEGARALGIRRAVFLCAGMASYQAQITGDPAAGAELLHHVLDDYPQESWQGVIGCIGNLVWCEAIMGRHAAAQAAADDGFARLPRPHLAVEAWEHLAENAAFSWLLTGDWQRARAVLEAGVPWWDDDVRSSSGRLDVLDLSQHGAADVTRWTARVTSPAPGGAPQALVRDLLARAAALDGDLPAMRAVLLPAWTDDRVLFNADQLVHTALFAARTEADAVASGPRDDIAEAERHLSTISTTLARFPLLGVLGEVWPIDLAAQLDRFHGRDARAPLREALAGWERIGHVPDAAVTHLALAEQEAVHGDREAARRHLADGRRIAERLEARPMLARADALAERYGLASRERRTSDVLTDREAEVMGLLAEGLTNGEIAKRLFMSPKTASVHVSHILAKLGVANRTEAAAVARRRGLLQT